jgi:hypothetical protein
MYRILFLTAFILSIGFTAFAQSDNQIDRQQWGVTDNVISIHETWYSVVIKGDQISKGKKINDKFEIESTVTFDSSGNKIEDIRYDILGKPTHKLIYSYDDKNNRTAEYRYGLDGTLLHSTKFNIKYNSSDKKTEVDNMNDDGTIKSKTIYKYDAAGNLAQHEWSSLNVASIIKTDYVCDDKGNVVSMTEYDANGDVEWRYLYTRDASGKIIEESTFKKGISFYGKYTYAYDDNGNKTEMHWFNKNPEKPYMNWKYKYEFDSNGNWTKQIQYNGEKAISIAEREIKYAL